jgi:hypothetical protein
LIARSPNITDHHHHQSTFLIRASGSSSSSTSNLMEHFFRSKDKNKINYSLLDGGYHKSLSPRNATTPPAAAAATTTMVKMPEIVLLLHFHEFLKYCNF